MLAGLAGQPERHVDATVTNSGATVTARNAGYNGSVPANGSTTFGLIGARTGSNGIPALGCSAT